MTRTAKLILAFDFGLKRIGVATGNLLTRTASPLTTLSGAGGPPWPEIDALIAEWRPDLIVVGQPGPDASAALVEPLEQFVTELGTRHGLTVAQADERFTSSAAAAELRTERRKGLYNRRLSKGQIDSRAACLIAEQWMSGTLERD